MEKLFRGITLLGNSKFVFPYCNCLLIEDDINCLIDSSLFPEDLPKVQDCRIDWIVNSHGHVDHCWRNADFNEARVFLHPADHPLVASGKNYLDIFGFERFPEPEIKPQYLDAIGYRERPADEAIEDGQIISTGRIRFEVLHLPGHTPGHCGFLFPEEGFLFSSDITLDALGPWFGNINSSVESTIDSIDRIIALQPELLVPGHGRVCRKDITVRLERYRNHLFKQAEKLLVFLKAGKNNIEDLARERIVYRVLVQPPQLGYHYECIMLLNHLLRLEKTGQAKQEDGLWFAVW